MLSQSDDVECSSTSGSDGGHEAENGCPTQREQAGWGRG